MDYLDGFCENCLIKKTPAIIKSIPKSVSGLKCPLNATNEIKKTAIIDTEFAIADEYPMLGDSCVLLIKSMLVIKKSIVAINEIKMILLLGRSHLSKMQVLNDLYSLCDA